MITKNALKILSILRYQQSKLKIVPFKWNSAYLLLSPISSSTTSGRIELLSHSISSIYIVIYAVFVNISYFYYKQSFKQKEYQARGILQINYGVAYAFVSVMIYNTFKNRFQIATFSNQFFRYVKKLEENIVPGNQKRNRIDLLEAILALSPVCIYGHSFVGALFFLEDPASPRYWYSLVAERFPQLWVLFLFAFVEYCTYVIIWHHIVFVGNIIQSYLIGILYWLREIHVLKGGKQTAGRLNIPKFSYPIYRAFQLLSLRFNASFSAVLFPWLNFFVIVLPVLGNNIIIRFHYDASPVLLSATSIVSLAPIIFTLIFYPQAASVNTLSLAYFKSLTLQFRRPSVFDANLLNTISKKHVKGCFPLKIKVGSFGFIQRFTGLKMVGLIFYWTMKCLLLTRSKH